eukprot:3777860-Pyramimonas_sp.AAC.1
MAAAVDRLRRSRRARTTRSVTAIAAKVLHRCRLDRQPSAEKGGDCFWGTARDGILLTVNVDVEAGPLLL